MKDNDIIMLEKKLEFERVKNEKLTANLDYVCMMTDVYIPEEREEENE